MKKFSFRLQKVLEYRELAEQWAKEAYLDARSSRLEAEAMLLTLARQRHDLLHSSAKTLDERRALEVCLQSLDDKELEQKAVIQVLEHEEAKALEFWTEKRVELEALQKLRDKAYEEWSTEANRKEQDELDEWSVLRRAA